MVRQVAIFVIFVCCVSLWLTPAFSQLGLSDDNVLLRDDNVLLRDDFRGTSLNISKWQNATGLEGRGAYTGKANVNGNGVLIVGANNYDTEQRGIFSQEHVFTNSVFRLEKNKQLIFRARLRIPHHRPGIVHSFALHNEFKQNGVLRANNIDFQWISSQMTHEGPFPVKLSAQAFWNTNIPTYLARKSGRYGTIEDMTAVIDGELHEWQTVTIIWSPEKVQYFIETLKKDMKLIGILTGKAVPRGKVSVNFKSFIPAISWDAAHHNTMQMTRFVDESESWHMEVDWVEVRSVPAGWPTEQITALFN